MSVRGAVVVGTEDVPEESERTLPHSSHLLRLDRDLVQFPQMRHHLVW